MSNHKFAIIGVVFIVVVTLISGYKERQVQRAERQAEAQRVLEAEQAEAKLVSDTNQIINDAADHLIKNYEDVGDYVVSDAWGRQIDIVIDTTQPESVSVTVLSFGKDGIKSDDDIYTKRKYTDKSKAISKWLKDKISGSKE
jgi:type II secretory pathway pseudopilin PulG